MVLRVLINNLNFAPSLIADHKLLLLKVMLAFRGWDNEEEHELASKCLVKIIERVETPADRVKYLKDIMKFADPSAFSCYKNIAENSLSVLMAWIKVCIVKLFVLVTSFAYLYADNSLFDMYVNLVSSKAGIMRFIQMGCKPTQVVL